MHHFPFRDEPLSTISIVEAVYVPRSLEEAPPWALPHAGRRSRWMVVARIENGPSQGQWALAPYPPEPGAPAGAARHWVPQSCLQDVRVLGELFEDAA